LIARRSLLKAAMLGAVSVSVATVHSVAHAQTLAPLSPTDPQATALGYAEDATKVTNPSHQAGQMCSSCIQYLGKGSDPRGACNIYPGKSVNARGWCVVWAKKNA
jgi:hypothetical protein